MAKGKQRQMTLDERSRGEFWRAWSAVALWTAVIFALSSDGFSANTTAGWIEPIVRWFFPGISPEGFERLHFAIRKSAHLTEYAVLALLTLRAFRRGAPRSAVRSALLTLGFVGVIASADELRQSRSLVRTGSPVDVGIDASGGALALACALLWQGRFGGGPSRRYGSSSPRFDAGGAPVHDKDL
jgi:hypothetical protein